MHKKQKTGENRTIIEIPLFDETKDKEGNTYPPLKTPLCKEAQWGFLSIRSKAAIYGLRHFRETWKVLVFPVKTDYNGKDGNDRKTSFDRKVSGRR